MFVVCHMLTSLDGKIDGDFFGVEEIAPALKVYGERREYYNCPAALYGTTTMLGGYSDGLVPVLPREKGICMLLRHLHIRFLRNISRICAN